MEILVVYDNDDFILISADNIKDCIFQFADYVGNNSPLFSTAMQGCDTAEKCVQMFNHFSRYTIDAIYIISKTAYKRSDNNE